MAEGDPRRRGGEQCRFLRCELCRRTSDHDMCGDMAGWRGCCRGEQRRFVRCELNLHSWGDVYSGGPDAPSSGTYASDMCRGMPGVAEGDPSCCGGKQRRFVRCELCLSGRGEASKRRDAPRSGTYPSGWRRVIPEAVATNIAGLCGASFAAAVMGDVAKGPDATRPGTIDSAMCGDMRGWRGVIPDAMAASSADLSGASSAAVVRCGVSKSSDATMQVPLILTCVGDPRCRDSSQRRSVRCEGCRRG